MENLSLNLEKEMPNSQTMFHQNKIEFIIVKVFPKPRWMDLNENVVFGTDHLINPFIKGIHQKNT